MGRKNKPNHGTLDCVKGRYYIKVKLPGTSKRRTYKLVSYGCTEATQSRQMAIALANEMWDRAEQVIKEQDEEQPPSEMTLQEYTDTYIELRKHELAGSTVENYKITIRYLLEFFGKDKLIDSITPLSAQQFKTALISGKLEDAMLTKKKLNRVTVNIHIKQARAILNFAVTKLKILSTNPFSGMAETIKQSKRWHYVTQEELEAVLDASTEKYRCMIALCRLAALRRFEAYNLEWQDVNFEKSKITIVGDAQWQPKDRETRVVPMCPELRKILLEVFEQAPEKRSRICMLDYPGNTDRDIKATIKRAGIVVWKKPLHTLRKSCITDWAKVFPIHVVKEWAGHTEISTTEEYYLKVTRDQYQQAATRSFWGNDVKNKERVHIEN